ncbi:MAG TPA: peptidoglycan-binding protein [Streptosporangiaceae bacterium]|nr:peptidoglycan-binding protein [Streptosporangiaceae bacterium]
MPKLTRLVMCGVAGLVIATVPVALVSAGAASAASTRQTSVTHVTAPIKGWPVVRPGSRGQRVVAIQYLLKARGYKLVPNGIYGPTTTAAVRHFQRARGLTVDGIVRTSTWVRLVITLHRGMRGWAVRGLQSNLRFSYRYKVPVDGRFGISTWNAVLKFQARYGLRRNGIVGLTTWQALVAHES